MLQVWQVWESVQDAQCVGQSIERIRFKNSISKLLVQVVEVEEAVYVAAGHFKQLVPPR